MLNKFGDKPTNRLLRERVLDGLIIAVSMAMLVLGPAVVMSLVR